MVKTVNDPLVEDRRWLKNIATDWFTYVELKCSRMYSRNLESVRGRTQLSAHVIVSVPASRRVYLEI
jgi:hypothetical protein